MQNPIYIILLSRWANEVINRTGSNPNVRQVLSTIKINAKELQIASADSVTFAAKALPPTQN